MFSRLRLFAISALTLIMAGTGYGIEQLQQVIPFTMNVPGSQTLTFNKFDLNLGPLQQVVLRLDVDPLQAGSASYINNIGTNNDADADVSLSIKGEIKADTMMANSPIDATFATPVDDAQAILAPGEMLQLIGQPYSGFAEGSLADPPDDLSEYIGAGETFDVDLRTTAMFTITIGGGSGQLNTSLGESQGTVTVTYIYIPEPASLAMIGFGMLGLVYRRRPRVG